MKEIDKLEFLESVKDKNGDFELAGKGCNLKLIRDENLYRADGTFGQYVHKRFGFTLAKANEMIELGEWSAQTFPRIFGPQLINDNFKNEAPHRTAEKSEHRPEAVVYFIQGGDFVKIGFSANPESRLEILKTSCPFELKLLTTVPGGQKMESELHRIFAKHRKTGEWFVFHQEIKDYIAKYL